MELASLFQKMAALFPDALVVMLVGMGVVFSFLVIMVLTMMIMKPIMAFLNKVFPEEVLQNIDKPSKGASSIDEEIAAAIAIAISR